MADESRLEALVARMTLAEKIGQMCQAHGTSDHNRDLIRQGAVGSILNVIGQDAAEYQRLARHESRLGIPLIIGRDVIHGFRTALPIPLGQAATFSPELIRQGARVAAREASACGVNWTFAPMVDIARDPRWGRIAEGGGEDPYLASCVGAAMVRGFQGDSLDAPDSIAACAKHYVGYGAAEGGRDYNTTLIPEGTLRDVHLPPFHACVNAGAATLMSAFNEINGVPASGNAFTIRQVLKGEWGFDGFVVSDWASVTEMIVHGFCADAKAAAAAGLGAGVDMEMVSTSYAEHLAQLVAEGKIPLAFIDDAVRRILRIKLRLGLFEKPLAAQDPSGSLLRAEHLAIARQLALESCVLLKNDGTLPLDKAGKLAVIGPLADSGIDQMGCWVFDGVAAECRTPLQALREALGKRAVRHAQGLATARSAERTGFRHAVAAARGADATVLFLGEEAILSGEAHCRAFLDLPGAQGALLDAVVAAGKPVVAVVMAGRPLVLGSVADKVNALLLAWHPGTMGGPAIADLLLGREAPSGRLPVCLPRAVGQVPVYYARKNTGRPAPPGQRTAPMGTPLDPQGFCSSYLDVDPTPLYTFGYGLTYATFAYSDVTLSRSLLRAGEAFTASVSITNAGGRAATAVAQLYVRDLVGSVTRPVKELKGFQKVALQPGECRRVVFTLHTDDLAFHGADMQRRVEPGTFQLWIAPDADAAGCTPAVFEVTE